MGNIRPPKPAKLFIGMLSPDPALFDACADLLRAEYGPIDHRSGAQPWEYTDYYRQEMGARLLRRFLFFERLIDPALLPAIKRFTNRLEERFAVGTEGSVRRRINLDPGYLTEAKVVLATTKDYAHRIFIGEGIYAEVTLRYEGDRFTALETTYPDYRAEESLEMFKKARDLLRASLKKGE